MSTQAKQEAETQDVLVIELVVNDTGIERARDLIRENLLEILLAK